MQITGAPFVSAASQLEFDAASVRPVDPARATYPPAFGPLNCIVEAADLHDLIKWAYKLENYQIVAGPKWITGERYEVRAKASAPSSKEDILSMLQALLKERFQLRAHESTQLMSAYELVSPSGKHHLVESKPDAIVDGLGAIQLDRSDLFARDVSMTLFARFLTSQLMTPVLDHTGLTGGFRFHSEFAETSADYDKALSIVRDLGLKLVPIKADIPVFVIDSAERPTEN